MAYRKPYPSLRRVKKQLQQEAARVPAEISRAVQAEIAARFGADATVVHTENSDGVIVAYFEGGAAGVDIQQGDA